MDLKGIFRNTLFAVTAVLATAACEKNIYDYEEDCTPYNGVKLIYDLNMKYADAAPTEVKSAKIMFFSQDGSLVKEVDATEQDLKENEYFVRADVAPGHYTVVAWCGLDESPKTWTLDKGANLSAQTVTMGTKNGEVSEIAPLFHGIASLDFPDEEGITQREIHLTKDFNDVKVMMQHLSGEDVDATKFTYNITADNSVYKYDNNPLLKGDVTYKPFSIKSASAEIPEVGTTATKAGENSVALAEFSIGRLMANAKVKPRLTIFNEEGDKVLSIPLVDYLLLVKGYYNRKMTDQEYLDRQDDFSLTFFLDKNDQWISSSIIINSWKVVFNEDELK